MADRSEAEPPRRNGKLAIPLPFEDAIRAALEVKPPPKPPKKKRQPRKGQSSARSR